MMLTPRLLLLSLVVVSLAGCDFDQPCDPGQVFRDHTCYAAEPDAGAQADGETLAESRMGATCALPADCTDDTDYCAIPPGAPSGYCTRTGCLADPSRCPGGWTCLDLSVFQAGLPAICQMP